MAEQRQTLKAPGLDGAVEIERDVYGVAHVRAGDEHDAWFAQGYVSAQDRLWQMEYDRRRAAGRWSQAVGKAGVAGDTLARRLQLVAAAQADVAAMSAETRAMFETYADGVNAYLRSGSALPVEYELTGLRPEPWAPWHSTAGFKIRHVLMGVWQKKVAQAQLLAKIGPEAYAKLDGRPPIGSPVILPPGGKVAALFDAALEDIRRAAAELGFLAEAEAGSNSWVVHGSRTTSGRPVLCNDSHRALDVPSVYWQLHLRCPEFDVIGGTFPGVPGFPHFGQNGSVGWNITHTSADYQDLSIEQFDPAQPTRYRTPDGWSEAERHTERIEVAGGEPLEIEVWRTRHGPVVHGDPRRGLALSLRYTATDEPCAGFEVLRPMLRAKTVAALFETQRPWVDPVNNMLAADTAGNIGYLTRGYLPIRSSQAHRQFPAPGWTGEHEWIGRVPFEQLPRAINPPEGFIATANQRVIAEDEPFISHDFAAPARAQRIVERLSAKPRLAPEEIAALQGDTTSCPARSWGQLLARCGPFAGEAERARALLAGWNGDLLPNSPPALLYGFFKREVARALFAPIAGEAAWAWLTSSEATTTHGMITRWMGVVVAAIDGGAETTADGRAWNDVLPGALAAAWHRAVERSGSDPAAWRWADHHQTRARHTLDARFPEQAPRLDPPSVAVGGDGDTIQAASYLWGDRPDFTIVALSVYRQVVDFADVAHASYVIPGGASGEPGSPHYADQLELWRTHQRIPMRGAP